METDIYIGILDKGQRPSPKSYGYVLEAREKKGATAEGFGDLPEATLHKATLSALIAAMRRFRTPCTVIVHAEDAGVLARLEAESTAWDEGAHTKEGAANREEWEELRELTRGYLILTEPGKHIYSGWLETSLRERRGEA